MSKMLPRLPETYKEKGEEMATNLVETYNTAEACLVLVVALGAIIVNLPDFHDYLTYKDKACSAMDELQWRGPFTKQ